LALLLVLARDATVLALLAVLVRPERTGSSASA
jgi:hypothetical protein